MVTLKEFLEYISKDEYSGKGATLDFRADRTFVISVSCRFCGRSIKFYKPSFRIFDIETICEECKKNGIKLEQTYSEQQTSKVTIGQFNLADTEKRILEMTLHDLGIPYLHIVAVYNKIGDYKYYELSEDKKIIFPNMNKRGTI